MILRARRRTLVVFRQSEGLANAHVPSKLAEPAPVRRSMRVGVLFAVIGLMRLALGARARWRPILAAATLTTAGVMLGGGAWGMLVFGGTWYLLQALLTPGRPDAERRRRSELQHELAGYRTSAQRSDLAATLDRYPDGITCELRDILAHQH
jgi:hypothetical protein